jgi:hypothetical protein
MTIPIFLIRSLGPATVAERHESDELAGTGGRGAVARALVQPTGQDPSHAVPPNRGRFFGVDERGVRRLATSASISSSVRP